MRSQHLLATLQYTKIKTLNIPRQPKHQTQLNTFIIRRKSLETVADTRGQGGEVIPTNAGEIMIFCLKRIAVNNAFHWDNGFASQLSGKVSATDKKSLLWRNLTKISPLPTMHCGRKCWMRSAMKKIRIQKYSRSPYFKIKDVLFYKNHSSWNW